MLLLRITTVFAATTLKQTPSFINTSTLLRYTVVPFAYVALCCVSAAIISDAQTLLYTWFAGIPVRFPLPFHT